MGPFGLRIRLDDLWAATRPLRARRADAARSRRRVPPPARLLPRRARRRRRLGCRRSGTSPRCSCSGRSTSPRLRWLMERWHAEPVVARADQPHLVHPRPARGSIPLVDAGRQRTSPSATAGSGPRGLRRPGAAQLRRQEPRLARCPPVAGGTRSPSPSPSPAPSRLRPPPAAHRDSAPVRARGAGRRTTAPRRVTGRASERARPRPVAGQGPGARRGREAPRDGRGPPGPTALRGGGRVPAALEGRTRPRAARPRSSGPLPRQTSACRPALGPRDCGACSGTGRFDLVHTHMPVPAVAARLVAGASTAVVHTEHNVWQRYRRPTYWANALTYRRNDAVIAVSEAVAASMDPRRLPKPPATVEVAASRRRALRHAVGSRARASGQAAARACPHGASSSAPSAT